VRKQPVLNKNYGKIQHSIIKNIKPSIQQQQLEDSIINNTTIIQQDDRMILDNAINILKQKFLQIRMKVQQFDPTEPVTALWRGKRKGGVSVVTPIKKLLRPLLVCLYVRHYGACGVQHRAG